MREQKKKRGGGKGKKKKKKKKIEFYLGLQLVHQCSNSTQFLSDVLHLSFCSFH